MGVEFVTEYFESDSGNIADEVRMHNAVTVDGERYTALILVQDSAVVTVYDYNEYSVQDSRVEAYLDTMKEKTLFFE